MAQRVGRPQAADAEREFGTIQHLNRLHARQRQYRPGEITAVTSAPRDHPWVNAFSENRDAEVTDDTCVASLRRAYLAMLLAWDRTARQSPACRSNTSVNLISAVYATPS